MTLKNTSHKEGPRIYNLFPRLAGPCKQWLAHIIRASEMGFNWLYINPFHPTGTSGSLYAIRDYFGYNPLFFPTNGEVNPEAILRAAIEEAKARGLRVMADLVINHTSKESCLITEHPAWYKRDAEGRLIHPGAMHKGKMVYWKDLVELDNLNSKERDSLWSYWLAVVKHYMDLGFEGFRCDAAYQVPNALWEFLTKEAKACNDKILFFGETLGCSVEQTIEVARSGFSLVSNSFKWWDLKEPWFLDQHGRTQPVVPSVSFPESHDTKRLAAELKDNVPAIMQHHLLSALLTEGMMIPVGFEFGFHNRLSVKLTKPEDWEESAIDLTGFMRKVNDLKASYPIFNTETPIKAFPVEDPDIVILIKANGDGERCAFLVNKNKRHKKRVSIMVEEILPGAGNRLDISIDDVLHTVPDTLEITMAPSEVKILYQEP